MPQASFDRGRGDRTFAETEELSPLPEAIAFETQFPRKSKSSWLPVASRVD